MHFWVLTARVYARFSSPRKIGLNWFIPALVNSSVGSSCGTTGDDGTNVWPCRFTKKSMNSWRICWDVFMECYLPRGGIMDAWTSAFNRINVREARAFRLRLRTVAPRATRNDRNPDSAARPRGVLKHT